MNNTENNHSSATSSPNRSFQNLSYAPWKPFEPTDNPQAQIFNYYQALGFNRGEEIWINTYDAGVYCGILGEKVLELWRCKKAEDGWLPTRQVPDPIKYLRGLGAADHNIQSYPNHLKGGLSNHHASRFTTVWYEIDDLPLEAQRDKFRWIEETLGLKATITVFSGGKSLHVYFTFDQPVDADTWTRIIRKLAIVAGGDPAICTHARAMRLPGVPRFKNGEAREVAIEALTGTRFNPKEFEAALDSIGLFPHGLSDERWQKWRRAKRDGQDTSVILQKPELDLVPKWVPTVRTLINDGSAVPLEKLLPLDDRALIASGTGKGYRNDSCFKLAINLLATETRALELGIPVQNTPRQLFEEACSRCTSPLSSCETEQIWRSASSKNALPSLSDEKLLSCAAAYQHRQNTSILRATLPGEISRTEWENRHKLQQAQAELTNFLSRVAKRSRQWLASADRAKASSPAADKQISGGLVPYGVIVTDDGEHTFPCKEPSDVPTPERMEWLGYPELIFPIDCSHLPFVREAYKLGHRSIQVNSGTGSGKSYEFGNFNLAEYPGGNYKIRYLTDDAENPTTATVEENFTRFITRHDGQKYDHTHHTPSGKPHVRRIKPGETPDIPGNCPETQTFLGFAKKGVPIAGGGGPVCESCKLYAGCEFNATRREQLATEIFLRTHPDQISISVKEGEKIINIWDEPGKILKTNAPVKVSWKKLQQAAAVIQRKAPKLYAQLAIMLSKWHEALMNAQIHSKYGLSFLELKKLLPLPNSDIGSTVYRYAAGKNGSMRNLKVLELADAIDEVLGTQIDFSGIQTPEEKQQWIEDNWHPNYFLLILEALTGADKYSNVTFDKDWNFKISRRVRHHQLVARSADLNIFLDATQSRGDLAAQLSVRKKDILVIRKESADYSSKLAINIVVDIGKCSQTRETKGEFGQQPRIKKLIAAIEHQVGEPVPVIDFKKYAPDYWFKDNRGSNAFKDDNHLILVGSPMANLGAQAAEFQAQRGKAVEPTDLSSSFGAQVKRRIRAEILQGVGRLRAQHSDKLKTCWIVGDGHDAALEQELKKAYPGCTVNFVSAADICLESAKKGVQTTRSIFSAIYEAVKAGLEVTKATIAQTINKSVPRIKQLLKEHGGFAKVVRGIENLVIAIEGKLSPQELDEDILYIAHTYLPNVARALEENDGITDPVEELADIRARYGTKTYLAILAATPPATLATILKHIIRDLPAAILERIRLDDHAAAY